MPEPTEEPSDEDQTPTPIAKAGIEALTIHSSREGPSASPRSFTGSP